MLEAEAAARGPRPEPIEEAVAVRPVEVDRGNGERSRLVEVGERLPADDPLIEAAPSAFARLGGDAVTIASEDVPSRKPSLRERTLAALRS